MEAKEVELCTSTTPFHPTTDSDATLQITPTQYSKIEKVLEAAERIRRSAGLQAMPMPLGPVHTPMF